MHEQMQKTEANKMKTFPDINALSMYVALVKTKSFKDAAKECGVTPSSVSQAVRALEEQYQVVLIVMGI